MKYDVIASQKTKGRTETITMTEHNELIIIAGNDKVNIKNVGGVGFNINSTPLLLVDSYEITSPCLAVLRLRIQNQGLVSIVNAHTPTSAAAVEREKFYQLLENRNDERSY